MRRKDNIQREEDGKIVCMECGEVFHQIAGHLSHKHDMTSSEYKRKYKIPEREGLVSLEYKQKLQDFYKKNEGKMKENLENGRKHRFS